jgi:hypothetical protein
MAQETDSAQWNLKVWAGTVAQLMRAATLAAQRVADTAQYPVGYGGPNDPRQGYDADKEELRRVANSARRVEVLVVEDDGFNRVLTAIDDLADIPDDRLARIGVIEIQVGVGKGYLPPSVLITVSRRNGLETRVCGRTRTWTAGLRHELQEELRPSQRLRPLGFKNADAVVGIALGITSPLWLGITVWLKETTNWVFGVRLGASAVFALLLGGSVAFLRLSRSA